VPPGVFLLATQQRAWREENDSRAADACFASQFVSPPLVMDAADQAHQPQTPVRPPNAASAAAEKHRGFTLPVATVAAAAACAPEVALAVDALLRVTSGDAVTALAAVADALTKRPQSQCVGLPLGCGPVTCEAVLLGLTARLAAHVHQVCNAVRAAERYPSGVSNADSHGLRREVWRRKHGWLVHILHV
jgi:hypothetical protein